MNRNPVGQRALSLLLSLALVLSIFGVDTVGAWAAQSGSPTVLYLDSGNIVIDGANVTQGGQLVTRGAQDSGYLITQKDSGAVQHTITVQSGTQDITLQNVHAKPASGAAFEVENGAEADITLEENNLLDTSGSSSHRAGLSVNSGSAVHISGSGSLTATGGYQSAGIGGNGYQSCGTVEISGGTVTATGGDYSAGLGGGYSGAGGIITINGGTITATGGSYGSAGIGGGAYGDSGTITISGGTVKATGSYGGAGIGGGDNGAGGNITITGGTVTATGCNYGAGIGGGQNAAGGTVTISGADTEVTAKGQDGGKDIGSGGNNSSGGSLAVSDGATLAMLNSDSSLNTDASPYTHTDCQIITGSTETKYDSNSQSTSVTLLTAALTAQPAANGAVTLTALVSPAEGGTFDFAYSGAKDSGSIADNVSIDSTTGQATATWGNPPTDGLTVITAKYKDSNNTYDALKAVFYYNPDAIDLSTVSPGGFGYTYSSNTVTINQNGWYVFTGSTSGAAANHISVPTGVTADVTLSDASIDVSSKSGFCAFSIAAGAAVDLTLEGTNTLTSGGNRAGLQVPGNASALTDPTKNAFLTVTAQSTGSLTATGKNSAGIGGSYYGSGGSITVSGGTVTATGGDNGAGIGGGDHGSGGNITVSGGTVTATGGNGGAGIGGGYYGAGGTVTVSGAGTHVTAQGKNGGKDIGSGKSGTDGGSLTVGDNSTAEPLPLVELLSAGINAANPSTSRPQFRNCIIKGAGANDASDDDISGCYDANGKIRLTVTMATPVSGTVGNPVKLDASVERYSLGGAVPLPGKIQFTGNGSSLGTSAVTNGAAQTSWTPKNGNTVLLKAAYVPSSSDRYASAESAAFDYTPGKITPAVFSLPTASAVNSGDRLSASTLTGGKMTDANGVKVSGTFTWANPNAVATASDNYEAIFTPDDTTDYNTVSGIMIPVMVNASAQKTTPVIQTAPTTSPIKVGDKLSASALTGGKMTDANGAKVSGSFAWENPDTVVTASGNYEAIFTPADTKDYNTVSGIMVPVTVTATSSSGSHSSGTSTPSFPSELTNIPTNTTVVLSGTSFPSSVTRVSLSVTPETSTGVPEGVTGGTADTQGAAVYSLAVSDKALNAIGAPLLYNIKLLDQTGNPASFTGSVTVRIPVPAGLRGTPRVFRYEESTGTFTDRNAAVENGFLVFNTDHFSHYIIAGTGDSITLDTLNYQMPIGGRYQIGMKLTGSKAATVKFHSTNDKTATVAKLKNGNYQVTGKGTGTVWIMFDVYDSKNKLLTHVSTRVDVKTGIRPRGDSTRQIGVF